MTDLPPDLLMRTVVYKNNIDNMGVVVDDGREERVKVLFGGGEEEWVPRVDLEDVTESYDYAYRWGLTTENHEDED